MSEGLGQLIFILIIIVAAAIDAMSRSRKKQRRMDEMEREEEQGAPTATREEERETADAMVPEDFWAILTGEAPPERRGDSEARDERSRAERPREESTRETEYRRAEPEPPREPRIPVPVPGDRYASDRDEEEKEVPQEEAAPTRRGAGWMEGLDRRRKDEEEAEEIRAQEALAYAQPAEPWGALEDIAAGQIEEGAGEVQEVVSPLEAPPAARRRARRTSMYTRLLESGSREDLRAAVVLQEVLGTPAAFRSLRREWDER